MDRQTRSYIEERVVTITEVDMSQQHIAVVDQFGTNLRVSMQFHDSLVSIPVVGERWLAQRRGMEWFLNRRADDGTEVTAVADLTPGDRRIDTSGDLYLNASTIYANGTEIPQVIPDPPPAGVSGLLAARPAASGGVGTFYYATDQAVLYFSDGSTWLRMGLPAGATTFLFGVSTTPPTGWVRYDSTPLPASTGIYADLATHLGGTATPDTRARSLVDLGTNADVNAIGKNEGVATVGNRRPKHRTSNSLSLPAHTHDTGNAGYFFQELGNSPGGTLTAGASGGGTFQSPTLAGQTGNPTSTPGISGSIGTNNANDALDSSPYYVGLLIAKL